MNDPTQSDGTGVDLPAPAPTSAIVDEIPTSQAVATEPDAASNTEPGSTETDAAPSAIDEPDTPDASEREALDSGVLDAIDLDAIERDLNDVQAALDRLNDGSYWTDEVTGEAIPDDVLAAFPLTRTTATATPGTSSA